MNLASLYNIGYCSMVYTHKWMYVYGKRFVTCGIDLVCQYTRMQWHTQLIIMRSPAAHMMLLAQSQL